MKQYSNRRLCRHVIGFMACICMMGSAATVYGANITSEVAAETKKADIIEVSQAAKTETLVAALEKEMEQERAREEAHRQAVLEEKRRIEEERAREEAARQAEEERLAKRQEIVDYALQFVGNPYVYGGTSLTNGADCSGFVQSVFRDMGYELPRVAADQAYAGTEKSLDQLEKGDLVFYDYGSGSIGHVAIYIGDGQIVHASTAATGIKVSDYDYNQPCMVTTYVS